MEQLDLLEQQIGELLKEITSLRADKKRLTDDLDAELAKAGRMTEEIAVLQRELNSERQVREQALTRVDALLRRIQQSLDDNQPAQ